MRKHNEQFEKNIARLVKSTGEQQIPSENFTHTLIDEALKKLPHDQNRRQTRRITMDSMAKKLSVIAASILIIIGAVVSFKTISRHSKDNPVQLAMTETETLAPIPLKLPKPQFVGTPENLSGVENLEKPLGTARPPFDAPIGTENIALKKPVSASEEEPIMGTLEMIVDGDKEASDGSVIELGPFEQWVQIDLGQASDIYAIVVWHYHKTPRVYYDVVVQVSDDPDFVGKVVTVFNNDMDNSLGLGVGTDPHYVETSEGRLIDAKGVRGRYVRLYSQSNNQNDYSNYIEVEVYGKSTRNQINDAEAVKEEAQNKNLVPIPLKLPKPMFAGTPQNLSGGTPKNGHMVVGDVYNATGLSIDRDSFLIKSERTPESPYSQPPMAHGGTTPPNGEDVDAMFFKTYGVNPFVDTEDDHLSTFAIDVDTGSYTVCRRYLQEGNLPPKEAVRVEEFVNYFKYDYPAPRKDNFAVFFEAMPWQFGTERKNTHLMRIGLKAMEVPDEYRKPAILTFVIDVSGSMNRENRLGLVKQSLRMLIDKLRPEDKIGIAVYGSRGRHILRHTGLEDKYAILEAIDSLQPEGSTNAEEGIRIGYDIAEQAFVPGYINRVILCSDGVANVGGTGHEEIFKMIKSKADKGVTLSALGFGMGNYNDVLMERLGDKGNGYYAYIDTLDEAKRLFSNLTGALQVVARDVKIQVDFNPDVVRSYRLIGYENRDVADIDFRNDTVDGGEIGAGHTTTALYELKLWPDKAGKIATTYIRYKDPDTFKVTEICADFDTHQTAEGFSDISNSFALASVVTEFAEIMRQSYWAKGAELEDTLDKAKQFHNRYDGNADVEELFDLIGRANQLLKEKSQPVEIHDEDSPQPAQIEYETQR